MIGKFSCIDIKFTLYRSYQVAVEHRDFDTKRQAREFVHYLQNTKKYIAAELLKQVVDSGNGFEVGDNKIYGMYFNPPLMESQFYAIYIGYVGRFNETVC